MVSLFGSDIPIYPLSYNQVGKSIAYDTGVVLVSPVSLLLDVLTSKDKTIIKKVFNYL